MAEDAVDVEAEPARHALIVDAGADLRAKARVVEAEHEQRRDQQR